MTRRQHGFTLIELVVALGIILLTVFVFGIAVSSLPLTRSASNRNIAYHAAGQKIEEMRNTPFAFLPSSGTFTYAILSELASSTAQLTMSSYSGYDINSIKQAVVNITWYENGTWQSVQLNTLISSTGLNQ